MLDDKIFVLTNRLSN